MSFTLGTEKTVAAYAIGPAKIVEVNTNVYVGIWIDDDVSQQIVGRVYSYSNGVWTEEYGINPLWIGDAWRNTECPPNICKIDTERVLITTVGTSDWGITRLLDISTTSIVDRGSLSAVPLGCSWLDIAQLTTNKAVIIYKKLSDTHLYASIVTVSGNVQSVGATVKIHAVNPAHPSVVKIATDKFLCLYRDKTNNKATVVVCTVSGTTITAGAPVDIAGQTTGVFTDIIYIADNQCILLWRGAGLVGNAAACTISGTIPTIGTVVQYDAGPVGTMQGIPINATSYMNIYDYNSAVGKVIRGTVDWGTRIISLGTPGTFKSAFVGGGDDHGLGFVYIEENIGGAIYQDGGDSDYGKLISIQSNLEPPTNVAAIPGGNIGEIDTSWDPVPSADYYNIYWAESSGVTKGTGTKITGATSPYTHTGRTLYQEYFYVITVVQGIVESDESTEVSAFPYAIDVLPVATPGDSENILTWPNISGATQYDIYWSTSPNLTKANGTKIENVVSGYNHIDLTRQLYYYIVIAHSGGQEYSSDIISCMPDFEGKIFNHNEQIRDSLLYQYIGN